MRRSKAENSALGSTLLDGITAVVAMAVSGSCLSSNGRGFLDQFGFVPFLHCEHQSPFDGLAKACANPQCGHLISTLPAIVFSLINYSTPERLCSCPK